MTAFLAEYDKDKLWLDYWNAVRWESVDHSNDTRTIALTGGVNTKFMRFCVLPAKQGICYLYDNTNAKYLYKGTLVI